MSEIKDDPREVLALLNSLGFVGITASQLKAFMKGNRILLLLLIFCLHSIIVNIIIVIILIKSISLS